MPDAADALGAVVTVARTVDEHDLKYPAAAMAYYAFVSFLPLLVFLVAVFGEGFAGDVRGAIPRFLTPEARRLVAESLTTASGRTGATALAVLVLAWSASNVAVDFQTVVERVEGTPEGTLVEQAREAGAVLGSLLLVVASVVLAAAVVTLLPAGPWVTYGWPVLVAGVLTAAFLPLYYLPSEVARSPRAALPGATVAAVGWTAMLVGIQFYAIHAGRYAVYGVLGGVIILLTSLYLASLALMVGVVVNVTWAGDAPRGGGVRGGPGTR